MHFVAEIMVGPQASRRSTTRIDGFAGRESNSSGKWETHTKHKDTPDIQGCSNHCHEWTKQERKQRPYSVVWQSNEFKL